MAIEVGTVIEMTRDAPAWIPMLKGDIGVIVERGCEDDSYLIRSLFDNITCSVNEHYIKVYHYQYGDRVKIISEKSKYHGKYGTIYSMQKSSGYHTSKGIVKLYVDGTKYEKGFYPKTLNLAIQSVIPLFTNSKHKEIQEREESNMAKLTGFKKVAKVTIGLRDFYHALYQDDIEVGNAIIVSGSMDKKFFEVSEVITVDELKERFSSDITSEVICKVDTSAYNQRVKNRMAAEKLRKEMDKKIAEIQENQKYELFAEKSPELAEMLKQYNELL